VAMIKSSPQAPANLNEPVLAKNVNRIQHAGLDAFLLALAAWQRRFQKRFLYHFQDYSERFAQTGGNPA